MSLVENERTKLLATALNNTAVAIIVTAVIAPLVGYFYGGQTAGSEYWSFVLVGWLLGGIVLHLFAQAILGRLKP